MYFRCKFCFENKPFKPDCLTTCQKGLIATKNFEKKTSTVTRNTPPLHQKQIANCYKSACCNTFQKVAGSPSELAVVRPETLHNVWENHRELSQNCELKKSSQLSKIAYSQNGLVKCQKGLPEYYDRSHQNAQVAPSPSMVLQRLGFLAVAFHIRKAGMRLNLWTSNLGSNVRLYSWSLTSHV